jgi:hypothetical protein
VSKHGRVGGRGRGRRLPRRYGRHGAMQVVAEEEYLKDAQSRASHRTRFSGSESCVSFSTKDKKRTKKTHMGPSVQMIYTTTPSR